MNTPGPNWQPDFNDLARYLTHPWQQAAALAASIANDGRSEANVDPTIRMSYEPLMRVAELQLGRSHPNLFGSADPIGLDVVSRTEWAQRAINAYQPLVEDLATNLGELLRSQFAQLDQEDFVEMQHQLGDQIPIDFTQLANLISSSLGPAMVVSIAGTTVGQLARAAFGTFDIPIPRSPEPVIALCGPNIEEVAHDWGLPPEELRLWVICNELARRGVLNLPHLNDRLTMLLAQHCAAFEIQEEALEARLRDLDPSELTNQMLDPTFVLDALRSPRQDALLEQIDAIVMVIEGYVDWLLEVIGPPMMSSYDLIVEALRRRRVEAGAGARFVDRLFGVQLTHDKLDTGLAFVRTVVARAGLDGLDRLLGSIEDLPTDREFVDPLLWCARVGVEVAVDEDNLAHLEFEIPDYIDFEDPDGE